MNYDNLYKEKFSYVLQQKDVNELISYFKSKAGWVYIAKSKNNPYLKIGRTAKNPFERAKTLSSAGVLHDYDILFSLKFFNQYLAEKKIHQILSSHRIKKEFFSIDENTALDKLNYTYMEERILLNRFLNLDVINEDINLLEYALKKN